MNAEIIYIIFVLVLMLICGILELTAYNMKKKRESKGIYEIIDEPNKFDEGDVHMLLEIFTFLIRIFAHTRSSSYRSSSYRSSGRGGGGRSGGGGAGRR